MKVLTVGIILFVYICSYNIAVAEIGDACTAGDNDNCTDIGQECADNGTCACHTANYYNYDGSKCVRELGRDCTSSDCNGLPDVICDIVCKCNPATHYDNNGNKAGEEGGVCVGRHDLGVSCTNPATGPGPDQCSAANAICEADTGSDSATYTCQCSDGFVRDGSSCATDKDECTQGTDNCHANADCSNTQGSFQCTCRAGYSGNGISCTDKDECTQGTDNCHTNADCSNTPGSFQCTCRAGYSGNGISCTDKDECTQGTDNCHTNADCSNTPGSFQCTCRAGYSGNGISCTDKDECTQGTDNCHANADCSNTQGSFQCTCRAGYSGNGILCTDINECLSYPCLNGGACSNLVDAYSCSCATGYTGQECQVASLGASCIVFGTVCNDKNASCQSNGLGGGKTCQCTSYYYDDNGTGTIGGTCRYRRSLGATCTSGHSNSYQCIDPNARCRTEVCSCNDRYHPDSGSCVPNVPLGGACKGDVVAECSDPNAKCIKSKCTCSVGFYRYYYGNAQSICKNVAELRVTGVTFQNVSTTQFTVVWTAPSKSNYVSGYRVDWGPKDNSVSGSSKEASSSPQIVTGLTPGKSYEVKVISKDTATEPDTTRTTYTAKDQASKPSVPGAVNSGTSELDASDGNITVRWTKGNGVATRYKIKLFDEQIEINSTISSSTSALLSPSNLLNGYNYDVYIMARSEAYNGNYLWSDDRISAIKTKVQVPGAPRTVECNTIKDESITLTWMSPVFPNGDLVRYIISVLNANQQVLFNTSTSHVVESHTVISLSPGTTYKFRVFTENEKYTSRDYGQSAFCMTKAKLSDPPSDLKTTAVSSRNITVSWNKPNNTYSEENYGYVIQLKKDDACVKEVVYKCSDCLGTFQVSNLENMCDNSNVREIFMWEKTNLSGVQSYQFIDLTPDTTFTISGTAVNNLGRGNVAEISETTAEEAPQTPYNVKVKDIETTSFTVTWDIDGPRPGKTNFTVTLTADRPAANKEFTFTGFTTRSHRAEGLEEYWNYSVSVTASTSVGAKASDPTQEYRTLPAAPGKVSNFDITTAPGGNYTRMQITWNAPTILLQNGVIETYSFFYYISPEQKSGSPTKTFQHQSLENRKYEVYVNVVPEVSYSFEVYATNEDNMTGQTWIKTIEAPAGVPENIEDTMQTKVIPEEKVKNVQQTQITVTFVQEFFEQSKYGQIRATGLVACVENKCETTNINNLTYFNNMDTWNEASKGTYRATGKDWLEVIKAKSAGPNARRKRDVTNLEYTVGSENCASVNTDEYCNGPLHPDTRYMLFAVACTNGGCLISQPYGPFITLAVPDEDDNLPMIIGIVVAVGVVVLIGAVVGFILLKRRKSGPGKMKPVSESDDEDFTTIDPAVAKIQRKRPILLNEIEEYVNKMHKDSNLLFSAEYEDLKTLSPKHACEAADREENRMRNRYINIIPFDHTRVKLSTNGEDDSSDYINANYLPGYSSPREYIGCQGPIPGTIDDFWRMTWEQNVSVVVMLTLCKEGQKIKCEQYWPDEVGEPKQYGDVIVEITSYSNIRTYDYRMFKITNGSTTRVVKHFHFLSWLDFQANVHHDIILDFIEHVRQHVQPPDTSGPMIIHCSAGVGRTGTYIALDHLMQFINEHDFDVNIDIFDLVLKLRENRQHMVQTEQQYVFIHDCVKEIMDRKRRQMENIYENQAFLEKLNAAQDENIYQNEQSLYENVSQAKSEQNTEL